MKRPSDQQTSNLKPEHQATLFPSLGYYDLKRNYWRALVHGRVFEDGRIPFGTRLLLKGLKRAMDVTPEDVASDTFQRRIDGFLTAPGRRRRIVLEIAGHRYRLRRRTRRNGSFFGTLRLPEEVGQQAQVNSCVQMMRLCRSQDDNGDILPTEGRVYLVPPRGVSVISDIDDTIKLTDATSKKEMLANTFLRPFAAVEGMPALYQQWQQLGCEFHYVSSSPWELYGPLAELCEASQFPTGSMHLRYFRVRDEMLKRFRPLRRNTKVGIIAGILKRMPQRTFVLVGDSGEKDPEIYRFLAKRFPERIAAILIREVEMSPLAGRRIRKLQSLPNPVALHVFRDPGEIAHVIDGRLTGGSRTTDV